MSNFSICVVCCPLAAIYQLIGLWDLVAFLVRLGASSAVPLALVWRGVACFLALPLALPYFLVSHCFYLVSSEERQFRSADMIGWLQMSPEVVSSCNGQGRLVPSILYSDTGHRAAAVNFERIIGKDCSRASTRCSTSFSACFGMPGTCE